ncbi:MAG: DUF4422 domain-containing protein [Bacteroides thetaiotaomicron]|nr:DUF4422 domain-containing protein [Bacteroides thetaiotaomicron]
MSEDRVKIIVATHKKYRMPDDSMYLPLHVGAEGKKDDEGNVLDFGYVKDNTGDNISALNASFCELTGLYWAWKNLDADYIGLVHYRRHFARKNRGDAWSRVLRFEDIQSDLGKIKVFVPNKRRYYIETLYSHYEHTHYSNQLDMTRQIISEKYPEYIMSYDRVIKHTYGYMFNMMVMEKALLNQYCGWLFDILCELGERMNVSELDAYQGRYYGRVSEIIFNVWLDYQIDSGSINKNEVKEIPCIHMEKINWWKKGEAFLKAKFAGKKYEGSF